MDGGTLSAAKPLPSVEEFARFLFERDGAQESSIRRAQQALLRHYAAVWANAAGVPNAEAQQHVDALFDELTLTADERQSEADFSADDGR